ncbi:hypothetical protein BDZ97DRAFT_1675765, partial [Flammula alnicola]
ATCAIDHTTNSVIQTTLRNELGSDVTVITVAHRLRTIMDTDKIVSSMRFQCAEFDSPKNLLQRKGGKFKSLVDESGDRNVLYAMHAEKS